MAADLYKGSRVDEFIRAASLMNKSLKLRIADLEENTDAFFVVIVSIIIFFMQAGFAFLEAGSLRSKNTTNILLKNMLDTFIGCLIYWAIGYAFAFGDGNSFIGYTGWFGTFPDDEKFKWFFQFVFAATACTIVSGSVAERCGIWPYFIYSSVITGLVYPVVSRWAWHRNGWLNAGINGGPPFQDFAGSGVVHLTGSVCAFFGAVFCGPRIGRFQLGRATTLQGHSVPLAALGAFILVFGFFAFNAGSQGSVSKPGDGDAIATSVLSTIISGSAAAVCSLSMAKLVGFIQEKRSGAHNVRSAWSLLTTINGALVGMVSVCAGCNLYEPWAAVVVGVVSSMWYFAISSLLVVLKIDDPLDAVAVHCGGGMWGLLAAPLLTVHHNPVEKTADLLVNGTLTSTTMTEMQRAPIGPQFLINLIALLAIVSWTAVWSLLIFGSLKATGILRVPVNMEMNGMDIEKHGEPAYPISAWKEAWRNFFTPNVYGSQSSSKLVLALMDLGFNIQGDSAASQQNGGHDNPAFHSNGSSIVAVNGELEVDDKL